MVHKRHPIHGISRWCCPVGRCVKHLKLWGEVRAGDKDTGFISVQVMVEAIEGEDPVEEQERSGKYEENLESVVP